MKSLRGRLLGSYTLVILLCLAVVGLALAILLARNSWPDRQLYGELDLKSRIILTQSELGNWVLNQPGQRFNPGLKRLADRLEARIVLLSKDGQVVADSQDGLVGHNLLAEAKLNRQSPELIRGSLRPAGTLQRWLFSGRAVTQNNALNVHWFVVAKEGSRLPIFQLFGQNLLGPLLQAALVALVLSVLLAWLISRWVARPVQQTAAAAQAMAAGNYEQQISPSGPAELQELARSFNQMAQQVRASRQAQQDFVANVSHDLKTPLTSIQGFSQAILDGTASDPDETRRAAGIIHDEAGRMRRMVDDLLLLARMDAGQITLDRHMIDLPPLLESCLSRFRPRAQQAGVELQLAVSQNGSLSVIGDGDRLVQLFGNLVDNAITHTPAGGRVTLSAEREKDRITVAIADTGPGIAPEQLSRIFERFYQVDSSRARTHGKIEGTGLGLAICQELAEAHKGHITAESVVGVGSKFSVSLPPADTAPTRAPNCQEILEFS